jgi:hypothetical protein
MINVEYIAGVEQADTLAVNLSTSPQQRQPRIVRFCICVRDRELIILIRHSFVGGDAEPFHVWVKVVVGILEYTRISDVPQAPRELDKMNDVVWAADDVGKYLEANFEREG